MTYTLDEFKQDVMKAQPGEWPEPSVSETWGNQYCATWNIDGKKPFISIVVPTPVKATHSEIVEHQMKMLLRDMVAA